MTRRLLAGVCTMTLIAAAGCADEPAVVVAPATGFLTVTWTVGGSTASPAVCEEHGARQVYFEVFDEDGYWIADRTVPCDNGRLGMRLWPGIYIAEASLLDGGLGVATIERVAAFVIEADEEETVRVDFSADALGE